METETNQITLTFPPAFKDAMLSGKKTIAFGSQKAADEGNIFISFGAAFQVVYVHHIPIGTVMMQLYKEAGYDSPESFHAAWWQKHPDKSFNPEELGYAIVFKRINHG